jgi:hypothetical protein
VRATIAECEAIWEVDSRARFVCGDPIIHGVPPPDRPDLAQATARQRAAQFEAWDLLAGRDCPRLGGQPRYLDIVSVHYYHSHQWQHPDVRLRWEDTPHDARWLPLHRHLEEVYERYRRSFFLGETSQFGVGRALWLKEIATEVCLARGHGMPVEGIFLYPILDRHDWDDPDHWHNSGLWDLVPNGDGRLERVLHQEYADELRRAQRLLAEEGGCGARAPSLSKVGYPGLRTLHISGPPRP